jgi:diketogulonate reductase-like aldo/keto reductase
MTPELQPQPLLQGAMEFRQLGSSPEKIPVIGLGTWRYSAGIEPLLAGIENGASLIDTAEVYGSEEAVGRAIAGRRAQVFLATKARAGNFRRRELIAAAEGSLRRLGTDRIDLYQLHWPNYTVPIEETMAAMEELTNAGKIRFIGVSNFSVRELQTAQAALSKHKIVSNQVRYSLIDRTPERAMLDFCRQNAITLIAFSPLGAEFSLISSADPHGVLASIAKSSGKTPAQVALNWLIAKENVVVIPKASSVSHAVDVAHASGWRLGHAEYDLLSAKIRFHARGPLESVARRSARRLRQMLGRQL